MNQTTMLHRTLRTKPGELAPLALSAAFFFCVLFGYAMIRPVREAMGAHGGIDELRWLFYGTAGASLIVAMAFGGLVHRLDRRRFLPIGYRAVVLCLAGFAVVLLVFGDEARGYTGRVFYVWFSVVNLFVTSMFWSFMADSWTLEQGKRLYPVIGVGGTLGAIAGSSVPWQLGAVLGPVWLMVLAGLMFEAAVRCMLALDRHHRRRGAQPDRPTDETAADRTGLVDGIALVVRSPYLLGVSLYIGLIAVSSTLVYFTKVSLVLDAEDELVGRIAIFGHLDLLAQVFTLLAQLFLVSRLLRALGVGVTLGVLPAITVVGFAALWYTSGLEAEAWQLFAVFAVFQALHRAGRYAVARPARETLFSVLSRDEKYKAKSVADLFVFRAGDVAGAGLTGAIGLSIGSVMLTTMPLVGVWVLVGLGLGAAQGRRSSRLAGDETRSRDPGIQTHEGETQ